VPITIRFSRKSGQIRPHAPRVLVICKKSTYDSYFLPGKSERLDALVRSRDPAVSRVLRAHEQHLHSIEEAKTALKKQGARAVFRYEKKPPAGEEFDLVIALGGDGTLLRASHVAGPNTPLVGINTAPLASIGHFCAGTKRDLADVIDMALTGGLKEACLSRMRVEVDGELVSSRVLNEALFCHRYPAVTSRYLIKLAGRQEEQKSSGVWVGPAAGSTAAQLSAGGRTLPISSRQLQFVVREPFESGQKRLRMRRGIFGPGERLLIRSLMRAGRVYLDGPKLVRAVGFGSELRMSLSDEPLVLLGFGPA
jgi:NAD+ kinase